MNKEIISNKAQNRIFDVFSNRIFSCDKIEKFSAELKEKMEKYVNTIPEDDVELMEIRKNYEKLVTVTKKLYDLFSTVDINDSIFSNLTSFIFLFAWDNSKKTLKPIEEINKKLDTKLNSVIFELACKKNNINLENSFCTRSKILEEIKARLSVQPLTSYSAIINKIKADIHIEDYFKNN